MSGALRCLVTIPSATSCLPGGSSSDAAFAIPRTHSDLVKFLYHDANYDTVHHILESIAQRHASNFLQPLTTTFSPEFLENDTRERLLQSLRFDQARSREMTIDAAHGQTCRWILQNPQYKDWLDKCKLKDHHGFLWIKGHPGTGKSTLMKYALSVSRSNHGGATLVIAHFFNARGADLEHSTIGLYRSLLVQLFEAQPGLLSSFDAFLRERAIEIKDALHLLPSNLSLLKALLSMLINKQKRSLVCFIDALDECATYEARDMILFLKALGEMAVESSVEFRVCLASRHYPYINIDRSLELVLDDQRGHVKDIATYIKSVLVVRGDGYASKLRDKILTKSQRIFMWVVLVVHILNEEYDGDITHLDKRLNDIPVGLHELFRGIISRDKQNYDKFVFCIQVILFAYRPLRPMELYSMVQAGTGECKLQLTEDDDYALNLQVFVLSTCKGLALITKEDSTVQFIHESVRDFLLKGNGYQELWDGSFKDFEAHSHNQLSACCRRYIAATTEIATKILETYEGDEYLNSTKAYALRARFETAVLLEYSATNILSHTNAAEGGGISQTQFLASFPWNNYLAFRNVFAFDSLPPISIAGDSRAQIYARDNLQHLILGCSPEISFLCENRGDLPTVLIAFIEGNLDAFQAICQVHRRNKNKDMEHIPMPKLSMRQFNRVIRLEPMNYELEFGGLFPCFVALADDEICLTVLKSGFIPFEEQTLNKSGRSVLSLAAESGKEEVVRTILDHLTPSWQFKFSTLLAPSRWIPRKNSQEYAFLSTSIKIDGKCQRKGITALGYACKNGHISIVKRLLGTGLVDPNSRDREMRTPLHYCTSYSNPSNLAIVQLLLKTAKIEPDLRDYDGRTPISLVLEDSGAMPIATALLETGKVNLEAEDIYGMSPLDYFGSEKVAESPMIQKYMR